MSGNRTAKRSGGRERRRAAAGAVSLLMLVLACVPAAAAVRWPAEPDPARVELAGQIRFADLEPERGFVGRLLDLVGGSDEDGRPSQPFDLAAAGGRVYAVCRGSAALVEIDPEAGSYRLLRCDERPLVSPVAVAVLGGVAYVSDSGTGTVYRQRGDELEPWITEGLARPTGLAAVAERDALCVVDTGAHRVLLYGADGRLLAEIGERGEDDEGLNFPTFAAGDGASVLVNDTMNYRIKRFSLAGERTGSFGREGDAPGCFARPKGLAVDEQGNAWVVDGLFDNVQVFGPRGDLLLVIGGPGDGDGEFWSPAGIAARGGEMLVADTFNDRIQILRILGGGS